MGPAQRRPAEKRKPVFAALAVIGAILLFEIFLGSHGLGRYVALREELEHRSEQTYERVVRNRLALERLQRLRSDEKAMEEVARSTLGVVHEDEIVIVFPDGRGVRRR